MSIRWIIIVGLLTSVQGYAQSNCTGITTCSGRGQCKPDGFCLCDDGYITWPEVDPVGSNTNINAGNQCNYRQTLRIVPFLLELFLGLVTGCGPFMLGHTGWGVSQLVLFWVPMLLVCCLACGGQLVKNSDGYGDGIICACVFFSMDFDYPGYMGGIVGFDWRWTYAR